MERIRKISPYLVLIRCQALVWVIILCTLSFAQDQSVLELPEHGQDLERLQRKIASYFKPLEGEIVSRERAFVTVNGGRRHGVKKGMRFTVFSLGEPFYHPVTREPVGNTEKFNGLVQITKVAGESAQAKILSKNPLQGNRIRISSAPIRLAFFQKRDAHWLVANSLFESLKDSRRFEMLETYTSSYEPKTLSLLSKNLGADVFILVSTSGSQPTSMHVEVELFWIEEMQPFAVVKDAVDVNSIPGKETLIPLSTGIEEPMYSVNLPGGELIAAGDIDGDSIRDIVISDREQIWIYSIEQGFREKWVQNLQEQGLQLSLDIVDVDKNGKDEIFITSLKDGKTLNSFVMQYEPLEGYRITHQGLPYFFRVTDKMLLMQGFSQKDGFSGPVYECRYDGGQYLPGRELVLPEDMTLYGFTYLNSHDSVYILQLRDSGRIHIYKDNNQIFKSNKKYSGLSFPFDVKRGALRPKKTSLIKGGIIPVRTPRGTRVLIMHNEPVLPKMKGLGAKDSKLYALLFNGSSLQEKVILSNIQGKVIDYFLDGESLLLLTNPTIYMYAKKALTGDLPKSVILYKYKITVQ